MFIPPQPCSEILHSGSRNAGSNTCCTKIVASNGVLYILQKRQGGNDHTENLDQYLETWSNITCFEFAENPFDDVRVGKFTMWRQIAALAKGMEEIHNGGGIRPYNISEFEYEAGTEYEGNIPAHNAETAPSNENHSIRQRNM